MFAARREHLEQVIRPALARGDWVLCDRFTDATYAYQGGGHGVRRRASASSRTWVHGDCRPDLTLLFDVPPEVSRERLDARDATAACSTSSSASTQAFFERVRAVYLAARARRAARFRVIDSTRSLDDVRARARRGAGGAASERRASRTRRRARGAAWPLPPWLAAPRARRSRCARAGRMRCCFTARAGVGKRALALHFARALLCESPRAGRQRVRRMRRLPLCRRPASIRTCGSSNRSTSTRRRRHADRSRSRSSAIRALTNWSQRTSHRGGAKVALIAPAEKMHAAAANALLKTLEEPPPRTYLLLVSRISRAACPPTIASRCQRIAVPLPPADEALAWLAAQGVSDAEHVLAQAGGAPLIARDLNARIRPAGRAQCMARRARDPRRPCRRSRSPRGIELRRQGSAPRPLAARSTG